MLIDSAQKLYRVIIFLKSIFVPDTLNGACAVKLDDIAL
jgi:hypothetical protein